MRSIIGYVVVMLAIATTARSQSVSYDDVMVIVNGRSPESVEIGEYFAARRGIPGERICRIDVDPSETMDSATFVGVRWRIQTWMRERGLTGTVNYIVTTKGCPLRITTVQGDDLANRVYSGQSSFEDCLVLMNGMDSSAILSPKQGDRQISRYFGSARPFARDPELMPMYLVTRLDGYSVDQVKALIHRAETPVAPLDGIWIFDVHPGNDENSGLKLINDRMRAAGDSLATRGLTVLRDNLPGYLRERQRALGYFSWGSNDPSIFNDRNAAKPGNGWMNGAIAETFVSTCARSFTRGVGGEQSLIADLIEEGVSGVKGYTDEPYSRSMSYTNLVVARYAAGFNLAESFYAGSPHVAWRQVVIGDPKMRLAVASGTDEIDLQEDVIDLAIAPNPIAAAGVLRYRIPQRATSVRVDILDLLGRHVATIVDDEAAPGVQSAVIDRGRIPAGAYFCRLTSRTATGATASVVRSLLVLEQ